MVCVFGFCCMMLEMKRVVILLSVLLLTCSAPINKDELNISEEVEVPQEAAEGVSEANDIIITAPKGFGKLDENGQSAITVIIRDDNTNVSLDVVSFIFSKQDESSEDEPNHTFDGSDEKSNTKLADDDSDAGFNPTPGLDVQTNYKELEKSDEETLNPTDDNEEQQDVQADQNIASPLAMDEYDEKRNSSHSEESDPHQTTESTEFTSNKRSKTTEVQTFSKYASDSLGRSAILHYLLGDREGSKSRLASLKIKIPNSEESISSEHYRSDTGFGEGHSKSTLETSTASLLRSSSEEEKYLVTRTTPSKASQEPINNQLVEKKNVSPTPLFSGLDFYPAYVNDEANFGPYDFGYDDPYGYQRDYDPNHYDPNHYDPNHYDPNHYDPNHYDPNNYDPNHYDPNHYDPNHYDPNHYDPNNYDPYTYYQNYYRNYYQHYNQNNYDQNNHITSDHYEKTSHADIYYEPDTQDPGSDPGEETNPPYSSEAPENPTQVPNSQDSQSEEQPEPMSVSPSFTPTTLHVGSLSEATDMPSNSSSSESPDETSQGTISNSEENMANAEAKGSSSFSSEESLETDQRGQKQTDRPGTLEYQDSAEQASPNSLFQVIQEVLGSVTLGKNQSPNQPAPISEEELEPEYGANAEDLANFGVATQTPALGGGSNEEDNDVAADPKATTSTNPENNEDEESLSNESTTDSMGVYLESTPESTLDQESPLSEATTETLTFHLNSVLLVSDEEGSNEFGTPNPSPSTSAATQSRGSNNANGSEESLEALASPTASPANRKASDSRYTKKSSEESQRSRKRNQANSQVAISPKRTVANPWTAFLQALKLHVVDQGILTEQSPRRSYSRHHQRSNRRKSDSSEEDD